MADARWEQIKAIFRAALAVDDAERRRRLLDRECGGDDELRREVESLLAANAPGPLATGAALAALDARDSGISTVARAPLIERAGQKIGPYKLLQQIGEGGFGVVFMAEQDVPVRRRVALKVIKLGMDTRQVVARFEQERQALALMDHPHIAKVLDAGATPIADGGGGRPFFVMEYVIGDPITAFADAHKLTIRDRLGLFAQVCAAVQHAHTKGVIHRDLKPRNVLVSMVDGRPHAKVIDFGIAKATGARLTDKTLFTEHRQLIGTPEYMSPEQAEGSPDIDTRTDVYALGVLLYELLTGATPFDARRLRSAAFGEMQRIIKEEEPPMPSVRVQKGTEAQRHEGTEGEDGLGKSSPSLRASVPSSLRASFLRGELDWIVMKALEKDRARRYESPSQFAADVQRHLSGEPVVAAPPSMAYRVRKFVRKHRAAVVTTGMVAAALLLGIAGVSWGLTIARASAAAATTRADEAEWNTYIGNLAAAQMLIADDKYPEARARLAACPETKRGVEWRFLHQKSQSILCVLPPAGAASFSPDSKRVLTTSDWWGTARLWETDTGKLINSCAASWGSFSPDGDCLLPLPECGFGPLLSRLLDGSPGTSSAKAKYMSAGVFSADGTKFALAVHNSDFSALLQVWDSRTKEPLGRSMSLDEGAELLIFSPDGMRLLSAAGTVARQWDYTTGELIGTHIQHNDRIVRTLFSPDGTRILTASDTSARLSDGMSGEPIGDPAVYERGVPIAKFSPDGRLMVTGTLNNSPATLRDGTTGVPEGWRGIGCVSSVSFSADSKYFVVTHSGGGAQLWDTKTLKPIGNTICSFGTNSAVFSPDGTRIFAVGWHVVEMFDLHGRCLGRTHVRPIIDDFDTLRLQVAISPDGVYIMTFVSELNPEMNRVPVTVLRADRLDQPETELWGPDVAVRIESLIGRRPPLSKDVVAPDGARRVVVRNDNRLLFLDNASGRELLALPFDDKPTGVNFSPDGTRLVVLFDEWHAIIMDSRDAADRQAEFAVSMSRTNSSPHAEVDGEQSEVEFRP